MFDPYQKKIINTISGSMPEGMITTRHTDEGHFYAVNKNGVEVIYPSVTGKLQIFKDESLMLYKMNRALDYVFGNYPLFTSENIMTHLEAAGKASADILEDAGDIGRRIHGYTENYFRDWIKNEERPADILSYIPKEEYDIRAVSALRALGKFCTEKSYTPLATELYVFSHILKCGGTLDDIGMMGDDLVLLDLKTSNQFKDHYFFQVALYYFMFKELTNLKINKCYILKVSKEDGTYKLEDLKNPSKLINYARSIIRVNDGLRYIKTLRKDNQKTVVKVDL